jgi:hypothetical protein
MNSEYKNNPFIYQTPDAINARDILELFVPLFGEFNNIPIVGHTIINGSRGSGKSMMFKYMAPDCQILAEDVSYSKLKYFSFYVPIKESQLENTDFRLINNYQGESLILEHIMVVYMIIKVFSQLHDLEFEDNQVNRESLRKYYANVIVDLMECYSGEKYLVDIDEDISVKEIFGKITKMFKAVHREFYYTYLFKLQLSEGIKPYEGPIFLYRDFLYEVLTNLKQISFFPNSPIYLLIDDADNLSEIQTKILNSMISMRTTREVSVKLSTQLQYKTYKTLSGRNVNTPHDFNEINLYDKYTNKRSDYTKRIEQIVLRRLLKAGFECDKANTFFPSDAKQQEGIKDIFVEFEKEYGYDYAYRYARPTYMKCLKGNLSTYSYSGFENIVNLSSGVVRHFIDLASRMYFEQLSRNEGASVEFIDPSIQDKVIKKYSTDFLETEFVKYNNDRGSDKHEKYKYNKLRNLIEVLGQSFHTILFSDATEKRVFSIALNDNPSQELDEILTLGVELGYLHKSMIGNKEGTGKSRLYILNRMLSPHFKLDPSSFAGYKFVKSSVLENSLNNPRMIINTMKRNSFKEVMNSNQTSLFDNGGIYE